jgi:hypothetical protein
MRYEKKFKLAMIVKNMLYECKLVSYFLKIILLFNKLLAKY